MQSIIMGVFFFFSGIGSLFGLVALFCSKSFIFSSAQNIDDINCASCHLNYYFYMLCVIQILGIIIFIYVDFRFRITETSATNGAAAASIATGYDSISSFAPNRSASLASPYLFRQESVRSEQRDGTLGIDDISQSNNFNTNNSNDLINNAVNA